jgi:hypothetical protein
VNLEEDKMAGVGFGKSNEDKSGTTNTNYNENVSGTTNTSGTTSVNPWDFSDPMIRGALNRGIELASKPLEYGTSGFIPATAMQEQGWNALQNAGGQIGGLTNSGISTVNNMLNMPNTIADNPQIKAMLDQQRAGAKLTLQQLMDKQNLGFNQASSALGNQYQGLQEQLGAEWNTANYLNNRNLNENIMTGLRGGAVAAGGANQLGSSRQGIAEGVASRGAAETMQNLSGEHQAALAGLAREGGQTLSNLAQNNTLAQQQAAQQMQQQLGQNAANTYFGGWQSGLQQQRAGMDQLNNLANLSTMPGQLYSGIGNEQRGLEQERINEIRNQEAFAQQAPWQQMQNLQQLLGLQSDFRTTTAEGTETTNLKKSGTGSGTSTGSSSGSGFGFELGTDSLFGFGKSK